VVVPLGVIGAIIATSARGLNNDVYFQVGLLTTVGLAVKNAILIVEFAKAFFDGGTPLAEVCDQGGAGAAAADPDDLDRIRLRLAAVGGRQRRRSRQPDRDRDRRRRRHG